MVLGQRKPIYVEIEMNTSMDALWAHTQNPERHVEWDLRFFSITYMPRDREDDPQRFLYKTRIGYGLEIAGTGITKEAPRLEDGSRVTTLSFRSEQPISLIRVGSGYWSYTPHADGTTFATQFNYATRFGWFGRLWDRLLFRPLFGYATAWSFDLLRIWLEHGIRPAVSIQRAKLHWIAVISLALLWLYQGLVPKLLYPEAELAMMRATGILPGAEHWLLPLLGIAEIGVGIGTLLWHRRLRMYLGQMAALLLLAAAALIGQPHLLLAPFNPVTLSGSMIALCVLARLTVHQLPHAGRCLRRRRS